MIRNTDNEIVLTPIKNEYCTLNALRCRKYHGKNKDLYKNVKPSECIIKN